jgi:hypothetical protein
MYMPPRFLTLEVVERIVREFTWPVPYTLEDAHPDGVWMIFPSGTQFCFYEGFSSDMELQFGDDVGDERTGIVSLDHAVIALRADPSYPLPPPPKLTGYFAVYASLEKVEYGLRDLCIRALTYLQPYMRGDRYWIDAYRRYRETRTQT